MVLLGFHSAKQLCVSFGPFEQRVNFAKAAVNLELNLTLYGEVECYSCTEISTKISWSQASGGSNG